MPSSGIKWHKLHYFSLSPNEAVSRDAYLVDGLKKRVLIRVKRASEKLLNIWAAELARRQADIMYHQQ